MLFEEIKLLSLNLNYWSNQNNFLNLHIWVKSSNDLIEGGPQRSRMQLTA